MGIIMKSKEINWLFPETNQAKYLIDYQLLGLTIKNGIIYLKTKI